MTEETGLVVGDLLAAGSFTYWAIDEQSGLVEHEHDHVFVALADIGAARPDPAEISALASLPFEDALRLLRSDVGTPWAGKVLERSLAALNRRQVRSGLDGRGGDRPQPPLLALFKEGDAR
jgi:hypothetical protein